MLCSLTDFPQELPEARRSGFVIVMTLAEYARRAAGHGLSRFLCDVDGGFPLTSWSLPRS